MTVERRDEHGTEFGTWLRKKHQNIIGSQNYSAQNLDYIWHNYRSNWFITIEEKRFRRMPDIAQSDTHSIVSQLLTSASGKIVKTLRGERPAEYRGHYLIVFEKTSPEDGWVNVNHKRVTEEELLTLLSTGKIEKNDC